MGQESAPKGALFEALIERSQVGICVCRDGVFSLVSPRFAELFGYSQDEMVGKVGPQDVVEPDDWSKVQAGCEEALKRLAEDGHEQSTHSTCRGRKKSGDFVDVEFYGTALLWEGEPTVFGTVLDVTERRAAGRAAEESRQRYRDLVELVPAGIAVYGKDGILFMNRGGAELLGAAGPDELVGRQPLELLHPEDREMVLGRVR